MRITAILAMSAVAVTGLTACENKTLRAPDEPGVCYHIGYPPNVAPRFNVVSKSEPSIEYCAARLYNLRREFLKTGTAGAVTEGAYNGYFLIVENGGVRMAPKHKGPSFPLLIKAPDGRLVAPGAVVQQREAPKGPESVKIPDNLPQVDR